MSITASGMFRVQNSIGVKTKFAIRLMANGKQIITLISFRLFCGPRCQKPVQGDVLVSATPWSDQTSGQLGATIRSRIARERDVGSRPKRSTLSSDRARPLSAPSARRTGDCSCKTAIAIDRFCCHHKNPTASTYPLVKRHPGSS